MKTNHLLILFSALVLLYAPSHIYAQRLQDTDKQKVIASIEAAAASIHSLQCDFTQTKSLSLIKNKLNSQGRMYYKAGNQLRWEYTTPYTYLFILSNGKVTMRNSQKKTTSIDVKGSRLFQEITNIMMSSVTGKCLSSKDFNVSILAHKDEWEAQLTPQKKEMKKMFSQIVLHINKEQKVVTRVDMKEQSGDLTTILLKNIKKNVQIQDNVFKL